VCGRAAGAALRFFLPVNASIQEKILLLGELQAAALHIIFRLSLCLHGVELILSFVHPEKSDDEADSKRNKSG